LTMGKRNRFSAPQFAGGRGEHEDDLRKARKRDAAAAWYCLHDRERDRLCDMAGVPKASGKGFDDLTMRERSAIAVALKEPEVRNMFSDQLRWGLEQIADVPREYEGDLSEQG
jgi:hypothetical protein